MTNDRQPSASRRIVVGVDRSSGAHVALGHAARRAGTTGRLFVTHVVPALSDAIARAVDRLDHDRHAAAQELVDRLAGDVGVDTETRIVDGAPAEALAELAREIDADEIVVGSRGMGRFAAALGSVSHALLAHADHPVVVVPRSAADHPRDPHEHGGCTVVVGYDDSPPSRAALAYAARRASNGGRVIAVYAFQPAPDWLGTPYYQRALDAYQAQGRELLQSLDEKSELGAVLATYSWRVRPRGRSSRLRMPVTPTRSSSGRAASGGSAARWGVSRTRCCTRPTVRWS